MALSGPLMAYISRGNTEKLELTQNGKVVPKNAVTRAVFKFGNYCIDTNVDSAEIIELINDAQVVQMRLGLVPKLVPGAYRRGTLTLFDALTPVHGKAWIRADVRAQYWPICDS